jgi:YD repeat-containing protein
MRSSTNRLLTDTRPPGRWSYYWDAIGYRGGREPIIAGRFSSHDEWLEAVRLGGGVGTCPEGTARHYPRPGLVLRQSSAAGTTDTTLPRRPTENCTTPAARA